MSAPDDLHPIESARLIEYWLGELDEAAAAQIDEHLLGCEDCSAQLAQIVALGQGIRASFEQGTVRAFVTGEFVERAAGRGLHIREYRVPCNGSVNCSVAPGDEILVTRLEAPLAGVGRVDAIAYPAGIPPIVAQDIPFDAASGEVVFTSNIAFIRALPPQAYRIRLLAVGPDGERVIGDYTMNHGPHRPQA